MLITSFFTSTRLILGPIFSRKNALFLLIFFLPFYTIIREILGGGFIGFLWPYVWIAILCLLTIIERKDRNTKTSIYNLFFIMLLPILFVGLILINSNFSFSVEGMDKILSIQELLLILLVFLIYFLMFIKASFQKIRYRGDDVSLLDWLIMVFILYGFIHIFVSALRGFNLFNAVMGFRYYFSAPIIFYLVRLK